MVRLPGKAALLIIVLLLCIGVVGCKSETAEVLVNWLYDWDETLSMAENQNKPIMIDFYTDSCSDCRKLDTDTYTDEELSSFLNNNFICLKSNAGKSNLYLDYKNFSGSFPVPTIVFTSPDGTEIDRMVGFRSADVFYQAAQAILDQWES